MHKISFSANVSDNSLQAVIDVLRMRESRWHTTGSKKLLLCYLCSVFDVYVTWKRAGVAEQTAARIVRLVDLHHRDGRHPIRTIIDATSRADRRSRSRWTQALRYAWRERDRWPDLKTCL